MPLEARCRLGCQLRADRIDVDGLRLGNDNRQGLLVEGSRLREQENAVTVVWTPTGDPVTDSAAGPLRYWTVV